MGANIGLFTLIYSDKFFNSKIIVTELDSENYKLLLKNTEGIVIVTCLKGVWNKDTEIETLETSEKTEWGYMVRECLVPIISEIKGISVDTIMKRFKIPRIDIFKMDIEGSEYEVFSKKYKEWLPLTQTLIIEIHD